LRMEDWQIWTGRRQDDWSNDLSQGAILFPDGATEMTASTVSGVDGIVMTYMPPMSNHILIRRSTRPEGPWSNSVKVFTCPESSVSVLDRKVMVYSAKDHPELASGKGEMAITYCCNPGLLQHYLKRPDIYYPRGIKVTITEPSIAKSAEYLRLQRTEPSLSRN